MREDLVLREDLGVREDLEVHRHKPSLNEIYRFTWSPDHTALSQ